MELLTTKEVATQLGVSVHTIRQWRYNRPYLEFPQPDVKGPAASDMPYWKQTTITRWVKKHRPDLLKN